MRGLSLFLVLASGAAAAEPPASAVSIGGYLQPQFRLRENSPAQFDQDGFRFARARVVADGKTRAGDLELSAFVEAELQPGFGLQDMYASFAYTWHAPGRRDLPGQLQLDAGQMRVPISRQQLLSDSRLSFVDKAQIATIAPDRDLGVRLTVAPALAPFRAIVGMFNGEGKNQVENINESYLYAARVEAAVAGRDAPLAESAFGGAMLVAAMSYGRNTLARGDGHEVLTYLGADVTASYEGLSASFEYLLVRHRFDGLDPAMLPRPFDANGFVAQVAYLFPDPVPPRGNGRIEVAARVEEIDRNDTIPIPQLGDPNQSVREITGVLSYYLRKHSVKAQLALSHFTEVEDRTSIGGDAAYDNDQLLLQITYRIE